MITSKIYNNLDHDVAVSCGWFLPATHLQAGHYFTKCQSEYDRIVYYPGSFGTFHEGHIDVLKRAKALYPNAWFVVAPCNSDYAVSKYGAWNMRASNKVRYHQIKTAIASLDFPVSIDIDPMMCDHSDQNFTDQLDRFLEKHTGKGIENQDLPPVILCGKDRGDFATLNAHTDKVRVEWFPAQVNVSTSDSKAPNFEKKDLYLRVQNSDQLHHFITYFKDQYRSINPIYIESEIRQILRNIHKYTHTNCKDYAGILPYVKVSRHFVNPLEDSIIKDTWDIPENASFIDSDSFSGSTRRYLESKGAKFDCIHNLEGISDRYELLDYEELIEPDYDYPFVDISSRCSMQAFDSEFHNRFQRFKDSAYD